MRARFLHVADLHLGMQVTRFREDVASKLLEARFQALENCRKLAAEKGADFVLVCGDLFDDNTVDRSTSERALKLLGSFACRVFVLPGNHDPLCAGSVWDRAPWQGLESEANVVVLRERSPVHAKNGVTLLPCPVSAKTSLADPFAWIERETGKGIRIGVGHGSVMDRATLPPDDHPIPEDTPQLRGLDYAALGHWHTERRFADERMAYPGTHEQMRYSNADYATGWQAQSSAQLDEFAGGGFGNALWVEIDAPGAKPRIASLPVGHLRWREEIRNVMSAEGFDAAFRELAEAEFKELTLIRVQLTGVLPMEQLAATESMKQMLSRYLYAEIDQSGLSLAPADSDLSAMESRGISGKVLARIRDELDGNPAPDRREVLEHARLVLYRLNQEIEQ
jgi:DNA repair exonuclease SbcCD nuclease subunit